MTRLGGISASATKISEASMGMERIGGISVRMGVVCGIDFGSGILWASDERLITFEGGFIIVRN